MKFLIALIAWLFLPITYAQTITIGTSADNPPFSSLADDKNNFYGFEIDIMLELCKRIEAKCEFTSVIVSDVIDKLKSGKIDFAIASIIILPDKPPHFIFSLPYLTSKGQFIVEATSDIKTPHDISGKTVGVRRGTLYHGVYFKNLVNQLFSSDVTVEEFLNTNDLMDALKKDDVDVNLLNEVAAKYWYINNKDQYRLIGDSIPIGEGYAILAMDTKTEIMQQINTALVQMEEDGAYVRIYTRYF